MIVRLTGFLLSLALSSCGFGHLIQGMGVSTVKKSGSSKTEPVATAADSTEEEEKKTISSETQKCRKFAGLFDVYQDTTDGSIKLAIRKEQIDKEYLYCTQTVDAPPISLQVDPLFDVFRVLDPLETPPSIGQISVFSRLKSR